MNLYTDQTRCLITICALAKSPLPQLLPNWNHGMGIVECMPSPTASQNKYPVDQSSSRQIFGFSLSSGCSLAVYKYISSFFILNTNKQTNKSFSSLRWPFQILLFFYVTARNSFQVPNSNIQLPIGQLYKDDSRARQILPVRHNHLPLPSCMEYYSSETLTPVSNHILPPTNVPGQPHMCHSLHIIVPCLNYCPQNPCDGCDARMSFT